MPSRRTKIVGPGRCGSALGSGTPDGGASETISTSPDAWAALTSCLPDMWEADCRGDGGGWASSMGEVTAELSIGEVADGIAASELFVLLPDLLDLSVSVSVSPSPLVSKVEFRGLSVFAPGIFDLRVLKDRADSLVSDFEKEGKDWRASGPAALVGREALPSFDGWLPITFVCFGNKAGKVAGNGDGGWAG